MNAYLNTLTVKALREIAKRIGFQFISRTRKAELISLIIAEIDACHTEAIREDSIRTRQNDVKPCTGTRTIERIKSEGIVSRMDYPVPYGRVVTEGHVNICREFGCVTYVKNGIDMGFCPRCGDVSTAEEQITEESISEKIVIDTPEFPMDHGQFCNWYRRFDDFEASEAIESDHAEAIEHNGVIDELYAGKAEDAGMSIPAYRACLKGHTIDGEIFLSGLWTTPIAHMHKVVTFDDGTRYGVSSGNASFFTGEVSDMPNGEISKCVHCKSVLLTPVKEETISSEMEIIAGNAREVIAALTPLMNRAYSQFVMARDNGSNAELVGAAYQVWKDLDRSIREMTHTLSLI